MKAKLPISVIGNRHPSSGFTLLELLVVVALIGLLSTTVMLTLQPQKRDYTADDAIAEVRTQLLTLSRKAISAQRWYGFSFENNTYQLWQFVNNSWAPISTDSTFSLPDALIIELDVEGKPVRLSDEPTVPQILAAPDGLLSPFTLLISYQNQEVELTDPYAPVTPHDN